MLHRKLLTRSSFFIGLFLYPWLTGFVLLSQNKATLPVSTTSPTQVFIWDGNFPSFNAKDEYKGGVYQDLGDQEFMQRLLTDAMDIWNNVPGSYVKLELRLSPSDAKQDSEDGIFSIVTQTSTNATTAAYASPNTKSETPNVISDCDITIGDSEISAKSLAFTIAHELGHCIGLGHAHTNYGAMMSYARDARGLSLGADDKAGLIYLYPDPAYGSGTSKELVCGVLGQKLDVPHQGLFLLFFPFITLLAAIVVRRGMRPLASLTRTSGAKTPEKSHSTLGDSRQLPRET